MFSDRIPSAHLQTGCKRVEYLERLLNFKRRYKKVIDLMLMAEGSPLGSFKYEQANWTCTLDYSGWSGLGIGRKVNRGQSGDKSRITPETLVKQWW